MLHWTGMRSRALPTIPDDVPFALLTSLDGRRKPWGYPTIHALARRIHRDRQNEELHLTPTSIHTENGKRQVVAVSTPSHVIGYAWIGGSEMRRLVNALWHASSRSAA